mgnify:CR=1 FL=1
MTLCKCGCISVVISRKQFINGHQYKFNSPFVKNNTFGLKTRFKRGHTPYNKNKKMPSVSAYIKLNNPMKIPEIVRKMVESSTISGAYEYHRQRLLKNPIAKYVRNPSKPQLAIFKHFKQLFNFTKVFCNYKVAKPNGGFYYLDIAIPLFKLNIEYDGYWHHKNKGREDNERDTYLKTLDWIIIRLKDKKFETPKST